MDGNEAFWEVDFIAESGVYKGARQQASWCERMAGVHEDLEPLRQGL